MSSYVFLGAPGAGKGTMAEMLCARSGQAHISTGDLLRAEMKSGSELGLRAKAFVEKGTLVPDEVVAAMVATKLGQSDVRRTGFVLDGYPRTVRQAELLAETLRALGLKLDAVVLFEVSEELVLRRLTSRWLCRACGAIYNTIYLPPKKEGVCDKCDGPLYQRADDSLETARNRLLVYERETSPLVDLYDRQGLLMRVTGAEEKHENFAVLCRALDR